MHRLAQRSWDLSSRKNRGSMLGELRKSALSTLFNKVKSLILHKNPTLAAYQLEISLHQTFDNTLLINRNAYLVRRPIPALSSLHCQFE